MRLKYEENAILCIRWELQLDESFALSHRSIVLISNRWVYDTGINHGYRINFKNTKIMLKEK